MSRIGKKTIPVPDGVKLNIKTGCVEMTGPKGSVTQTFPEVMSIEYDQANKSLKVVRPDDEKLSRSYHGLTRTLLANAMHGVTQGYQRTLEITGTGYNAKLKGKHLELQVGFCLPQPIMIPDGISVDLPTPIRIIIRGCNKQLVGQFAANVRAIRPPDNYKGKGIKYEGEVVKIKAGKAVTGSGS